MLAHAWLGAVLALCPLSAFAHPSIGTRQMTSVLNTSSSDLSTISAFPLNGPADVTKDFEYYAREGVKDVQSQIENLDPQLIEVHTFKDNKPSADVRSFIKMKINVYRDKAIRPDYFYTYNWDTDDVRRLVDFSPLTGDRNWRRLGRFDTFQLSDLKITMARAFQILHNAQWTDEWGQIFIGKFRQTPPGHTNEPFYAFFDPKRPAPHPQWVYVGAVTGSVIQDGSPMTIPVPTAAAEAASAATSVATS